MNGLSSSVYAVAAILLWSSCECQARDRSEQTAVVRADATARATTLERGVSEPGSPQPEQVAALVSLLANYYPGWSPQHESAEEYFARFYDAPESRRLRALIRKKSASEHGRWQAYLSDLRSQLTRQYDRNIVA
ncbi:MAG: hypothetical protein AAGC55_05375, partial [Myxococcota bacterium]